jgi:hypothetical protein
MNEWTVILHFGRDNTKVCEDLTKEQAQQVLSNAVFESEYSVNCTLFRNKLDVNQQIVNT